MHERFVALIYNFEASVVKLFLMCLKFAKLHLIQFTAFLTCALNLSCESIIIPKYLNSTTESLLPSTVTSGSGSLFADLEKNMHTRVLTGRCRQDFVNQLEIMTVKADSSFVACLLFLAFRCMTYQTLGRSLINKRIITEDPKLNLEGHQHNCHKLVKCFDLIESDVFYLLDMILSI